jgi:hypothetical protein
MYMWVLRATVGRKDGGGFEFLWMRGRGERGWSGSVRGRGGGGGRVRFLCRGRFSGRRLSFQEGGRSREEGGDSRRRAISGKREFFGWALW